FLLPNPWTGVICAQNGKVFAQNRLALVWADISHLQSQTLDSHFAPSNAIIPQLNRFLSFP
ncbi:MAG: hypothetical protein ACYS8I_12835, partial [Planctomycetota bacterium]